MALEPMQCFTCGRNYRLALPEGRSEPYCCKRMRLTVKETLSSFEAFSTGGIFPQVIEPCAQGEGSSGPTVFFIGRLSADEASDPKST